ncbi:unnamed protein product [Effrenium voratum]|nr:unnamed protein product [Effrenium voratum]
MKRWGCSYAALVVALAAASPESPDQQVQETLRRQRLEEKFARWRRTPVARHHRPVLVATYSYLPPKPVEEVQTPSLQDDQWEKDYEAFETLQKAKGGQHPAMALLMRSQGGLEARVARVLQQTKEDQEDSATRQERLQREERQRFRQAKAMEADHHLAKMQAAKQKSAEVALMRVQGEAQQTQLACTEISEDHNKIPLRCSWDSSCFGSLLTCRLQGRLLRTHRGVGKRTCTLPDLTCSPVCTFALYFRRNGR